MRLDLLRRGFALAALAFVATPLWAQTSATDAWVRGTVSAQTASGGFMTLTSPEGAVLLEVSSPVAGKVEIHEMKMENDVSRMRRVDRLPLPAGKAVELRPGGYHLMLLDLKQPLKAGDSIPLKLRIEEHGGKIETLDVRAAVRALGAANTSADSAHSAHAH